MIIIICLIKSLYLDQPPATLLVLNAGALYQCRQVMGATPVRAWKKNLGSKL